VDKAGAISEIISLQKRAAQVLGSFAIDSWRKLDVPMAQFKSLFIIINKGGTNFRMLAQDLGVTSGNVTGIIDRLVEQGMVTRKQNPADRREIRLEATEKGKDLMTNLMEVHTEQMTHVLTHMNLEELNSLSQGLAGLIRAVEEHQGEGDNQKNNLNS
jgi:MarR family transcriptional regulator, organic hydroperoxide resistance regulator